MTIALELPVELETELSAEAARQGLGLPEYMLRLLTTGRAPLPTPASGAELVHYWQSEGLIGSRPEIIDSQAHARQIRDEAERRVRD